MLLPVSKQKCCGRPSDTGDMAANIGLRPAPPGWVGGRHVKACTRSWVVEISTALRHWTAMGILTSLQRLFLVPLALAAAGAASRWMFQMTETRLQIAAFVVLAAAIESFSKDWGGRPSRARFALSAAAVTCSISAMRWHLEGIPTRIATLLAHLNQ